MTTTLMVRGRLQYFFQSNFPAKKHSHLIDMLAKIWKIIFYFTRTCIQHTICAGGIQWHGSTPQLQSLVRGLQPFHRQARGPSES